MPLHPVALAQAPPGSGVRLQAGNLVYIGAFRLPTPSGGGEQNTFGYGGEAMAFDPYRQSLWITGHDWHDRLAEVSIPTPGTGPVSSLPRASVLTPWIDMTWREKLGGSQVNMGGIAPQANGDLVLSAYVYYDANNQQNVSHVRRRANGTITAPVRVGASGRTGFVSGYMTPIPPEWGTLLGGTWFTGNSSLSIISRTSLGPAAWVFDPSDVGMASPVPATELLGYPINHPTLGTCETGTVFNCLASNNRGGTVFPNGTRTLLYFHRICSVPPTYGGGGWGCRGALQTRVLALDALDLVAVKNGQKRPWDVVPYATWEIGPPLSRRSIKAVTYDPARKWIFAAEDHGDGAQPLIHVYEVDAAASAFPSSSGGVPSIGQRRAGSQAGESLRHAAPRFRATNSGENGESDRGSERGDSDRGDRATTSRESGKDTTPAAGPGTGMMRQRALARARATTPPPRDRMAPVARTTDARRATPAPVVACQGDNPFANSERQIGICANGAWTLVPGIRTSGVVRHYLAAGGEVWLIETDEAVYEVAGGLDAAYQTDGLEVVFEGRFPSDATSGVTRVVVIEIHQVPAGHP